MVAPIVPFVVGMLSNLAARKAKAEAADAARSVADYEHQQAMALEELKQKNKYSNNFFTSLNTAADGSMFPDISRGIIPFKMDEKEMALVNANPEAKYRFDTMQIMSNLKWEVKGGDANSKAYNNIAQFGRIDNDRWAYIREAFPKRAEQIKQSLVGSFNSIDRLNNVGDDGTHSGGELDHEVLFSSSPKWIREIIQGMYEVGREKVINENNELVPVDKNIPTVMYDTLIGMDSTYVNNQKGANKWFNDSATMYSIYSTSPQTKRRGSNFIRTENGAQYLHEHEAEAIGWTLLGDIFTKPLLNNDGQLIDVVAVERGAFTNKKLPERVKQLVNIAHNYTNVYEEGSQKQQLNSDGFYFNELDYNTFLINAIASTANKHNIPNNFVSRGKKTALANKAIFSTSDDFFEDRFDLTPTIKQGYRDVASSGILAMEVTDSIRSIIAEDGIAGTAVYGAFQGVAQIKGVYKFLTNFFSKDAQADDLNPNFITSDVQTNLEAIDKNIERLSVAPVDGETAIERQERQKSLKANQQAHSLLSSIDAQDLIDSRNMAYKLVDGNTTEAEKLAINGARLKLLRASLVFYAAAIFQGEGGKAISDGDRILVTNALAVGNFTSAPEALVALAEFDRGMARITAKAQAISSNSPGHVFAALNLDNIVPRGNTADALTGGQRTIGRAQDGTAIRRSSGETEVGANDDSILFDGQPIELDFLFDVNNYDNEETFKDTINAYISNTKDINDIDRKKIQARKAAMEKEQNQRPSYGG